MKRIALILTIGMATSLIGLTASSGATLLVDFSGDTVGQPPAGATITGTGTASTILVASGTFAANSTRPINNPFPGNSLQFLKEETGTVPNARWSALPAGDTGTLDFTAYSFYSGDWSQTFFDINLRSTAGVIGLGVTFNGTNMYLGSGGTDLLISKVDNPWLGNALRNQILEVLISFSLVSQTYSVAIGVNGGALNDVIHAGETTFAFRNTVSEFENVNFGYPGQGYNRLQTYLDSFEYTAVPEPSVGMLLGVALLGLGFLRRRTARVRSIS